jgi:23S rRNA (pseudouridine1915-N3)-methyltransferase
LIETPERESPNGEERTKRDEAAFIFERVEKNKGYTIAFDRSGAELDSPAFAEFIHAAANDGSGVINLIIGGSRGLDPDLLQRADKILSFGKPTYPHRLFRVMLAEQLYRAFMIKNNREYHK